MSDSQIVAGGKTVSGPASAPGTFHHHGAFAPDFSADPGDPVTIFDALTPCRANAADTSNCSGFCINAGEEGGGVTVQYAGPLTLPTAVWDDKTGESGGLTPHAVYYLSAASAGKITKTKPSTPGEFVTPVGFAHNANTLMIQLGAAVVIGGG